MNSIIVACPPMYFPGGLSSYVAHASHAWWFKAGEEQTDEGNWRLKCHEQYYSGFHFFREESDAEEFLEGFGWSDVAHLVKVKYSEAVLEGLQETMDVIVANKYTITEYIRCYHEDEEV